MSRQYSREFKVQALELLSQSGMTITQAARDLGVSKSQLYKWQRAMVEDGAAAFPGRGNLLPRDEQMRRLKRDNERLRMERDILKKAAIFFVKEETRD